MGAAPHRSYGAHCICECVLQSMTHSNHSLTRTPQLIHTHTTLSDRILLTPISLFPFWCADALRIERTCRRDNLTHKCAVAYGLLARRNVALRSEVWENCTSYSTTSNLTLCYTIPGEPEVVPCFRAANVLNVLMRSYLLTDFSSISRSPLLVSSVSWHPNRVCYCICSRITKARTLVTATSPQLHTASGE